MPPSNDQGFNPGISFPRPRLFGILCKPALTPTPEHLLLAITHTLRSALTRAIAQLDEVPDLRTEAREEATQLLLHVLNISRASLLTSYDHPITPQQQAAFHAAIDRRLAKEPIQYITGEREFYGLPMRVTPAVLIPRNLTEHLVEAALDALRPRDQSGETLRIIDVGTGSGAIAIALAVNLPNAQLTALDLSADALAIAASNARLNGVAPRIRFLHSNLLDAVATEPPFDAIVSNPPYIPTTDRDSLHPQVRDYEPASALFAGPTGLDIYTRLIPQASAALKPQGLFALEIGPDQVDPISTFLSGWHHVHFINDLQGAPRIAIARKPWQPA